jgi:tetratricopeptide (TPR) repeat protein
MGHDDTFAAALALRKNGDLAGAIRLLVPLKEEHLQSAALYVTLGDLHKDLGQLEAALPYFQEATNIGPTSEVASLGLFHCLWAMDRRIAALDEIKRFLSVTTSEQYDEILAELTEDPE